MDLQFSQDTKKTSQQQATQRSVQVLAVQSQTAAQINTSASLTTAALDGKFSIREAGKQFVLGVASPVTALVSSPKNFVIGVGIISGIALLKVATGAVIMPVLVTVGVGYGVYRVSKAGVKIYKAYTSGNGDYAESAMYDLGSATVSFAAASAGARGSLRAMGHVESSPGRIAALVDNIRCAPEAVIRTASMFRSGAAAENIRSTAAMLVPSQAPSMETSSSNPLNLHYLDDPSLANGIAGKKAIVAATAGYMKGPDGYEQVSQKVLMDFIHAAGAKKVALVTSPTTDPGSIDLTTTVAAQKTGAHVVYVTADKFVSRIDTLQLPSSVDRTAFALARKYVLPDGPSYSAATAKASNSIIVAGGRNNAVSDFVNSIRNGNRAVLVKVEPHVAWDTVNGKVANASVYISEQIQSVLKTGELRWPAVGGLSREFILNRANVLKGSVRLVDSASSKAGFDAAQHLRPFPTHATPIGATITPVNKNRTEIK